MNHIPNLTLEFIPTLVFNVLCTKTKIILHLFDYGLMKFYMDPCTAGKFAFCGNNKNLFASMQGLVFFLNGKQSST